MAKPSPKTQPTTTPTPPTTKAPAAAKATSVLDGDAGEGLDYRAMALVPVKGGFVTVLLTMEGRRVVDAEILTEGVVPRHHAEDAYIVESQNHILGPAPVAGDAVKSPRVGVDDGDAGARS